VNPGTRLGPYQILSSIGAGGMGEVYRARDTRLNRDVAVKTLPELFAADPDRVARFEREAQTLASLNHPNIAHIYGIEDRALVMELVEGEDLAGRIARGPIPLDEAIAIARQIAEGLEAAHDRGIVHRDLKPANVKISPDGTVKILDFGLAKALDPAVASVGAPDLSPTFTSPALTSRGVILGTAAYMSPEQARGRPVDRRADIWAFGALLYEMLTGTQPFGGDTVTDALAHVLTRDPDWDKLSIITPAPLRTLIHRCLERDPRKRLQAIGEARIALSDPAALSAAPRPSTHRVRNAAVVALVGIVAAAVGFTMRALVSRTAPASAPVRSLDIAVPDFHVRVDGPPQISPNGQWIVYSDGAQLWTRSLSEFTTRKVPDSAGARYPFWSPESRDVAFVRDGKLWKAAIDGTTATSIAPVPGDMTGTGGGVWLGDGEMLLVGSDTVGMLSVNARDGSSREVLKLANSGESDFHEITALPDRRGVLFTVHSLSGPDKIDVFTNGTRKTLLRVAGETLRSPVYAAPGYLLYSRHTTSPGIWAVRFSLDRLETEGDPFLVVANGSYPSAAVDGTLALVRASDLPSEIVSVDRTGSLSVVGPLQGQAFDAGQWPVMALSHDSRLLAIGITAPAGNELWKYDLERGITTRLTTDSGVVVNPVWSVDGSRVLFAAFAGHRVWNVFAVSSGETGKPERVMPPADESQWPCSLSPDGRSLIYVQVSSGNMDLWVTTLDGTAGHPLLTKTPFNESDAAFSPDGHAIAYTSDESGRTEVYVRAFPIDARRTPVSTGGGAHPRWSRDGSELFYRIASGIASARITRTTAGVDASNSGPLFKVGSDATMSASFAVAPDGQHFLFARSTGADRLSVILNWTSQLRR
jgi:eukaryotic-like serine/threonine-protein kinase